VGIAVLLASVVFQIMASEGYRLWKMGREIRKGDFLEAIETGAKVLRVRVVDSDFNGTYPVKAFIDARLGGLFKEAFRGAVGQVEGMLERMQEEDLQPAGAEFQRLVSLRLHAEQTFQKEDAGRENWSRWVQTGGAILGKRYAEKKKSRQLRLLNRLLEDLGLSPAVPAE